MTTSRVSVCAELIFFGGLMVLPFFFQSGAVLSIASLVATMAVATVSYNILLGQTGLLSFGHAFYVGLGGFAVAHVTRLAADQEWGWFSIAVAPLAGGFLSLAVALLIGRLNVQRAGVVFSMITLGFAEMIHVYALMDPSFFGGDEGVSFDRTVGTGLLGMDFGPQIQVYGLIVIWLLIVLAVATAFRTSILGDLCRAVRDNETRVQFLGFRVRTIRYLAFCLAAFLAGVSGGLAAINYEVVSAEILSLHHSGAILIATYIGGVGSFAGSVIGAIVYVFFDSVLSNFTGAWPFHLGMIFIASVLFAPAGVVGLIRQAPGRFMHFVLANGWVIAGGYMLTVFSALGFYVGLIEAVYGMASDADLGLAKSLMGVSATVLIPMVFVLFVRRSSGSGQGTENAAALPGEG